MTDVNRELVVRWFDPAISAERVRDFAGIDILRAGLAGDIPPPPFALLMGFRLVDVDAGIAVFEGTPGEQHYNPIGLVHGGYALALCDSALGCAIQTLLPAGVGYGTTDVQVRMIRAITKHTGTVRCEGKAIHVGRSTAVAEAKLYDRERRLLAIATTACQVLRSEK